jgi:hypothetical protein
LELAIWMANGRVKPAVFVCTNHTLAANAQRAETS